MGILRFIKELFRLNFVSYKAVFGRNVRLDHFIVIEEDVGIGDNTWIGSWTHVRPGTIIGYNSEVRDQCHVAGKGLVVGNYTKVLQQSNLTAGMRIGDRCFIGAGLATTNTKNIKRQRETGEVDEYEWDLPVIEDDVRIGANVTILPGVVVARGSFVGGGAVVTRDTESYGVYMGNPACKIEDVPKDEKMGDG